MSANTKFYFTWKIKNVSNFHSLRDGGQLISPSFKIKYYKDILWNLNLLLNEKNVSDWSSFFLCWKDSRNRVSELKAFSIEVSISGLVRQSRELDSNYIRENNEIVWHKFVRTDELQDYMTHCTDDTLTITCWINGKSKKRATGCMAVSYLWLLNMKTLPSELSDEVGTIYGIIPFKLKFSNKQNFVVWIEISQVYKLPEEFRCEISAWRESVAFKQKSSCFTSKLNNFVCEIPDLFESTLLGKLTSKSNFILKCDFLPTKEMKMNIPRDRNETILRLKKSRNNFSGDCSIVSELLADFDKMCMNPIYSDVKLHIAGKEIPAHKLVLAARSPYFSEIFNRETAEIGIVKIYDCNWEIFELFMKFLYSGKFELSAGYEQVLDLYLLAHKYQVLSLKDACSTRLIPLLTQKTIFEVLTLSDSLNDSTLKESAITFIENNAPLVIKSPEWLEWIKTHIELSTEVYAKLSERFKCDCLKRDHIEEQCQ